MEEKEERLEKDRKKSRKGGGKEPRLTKAGKEPHYDHEKKTFRRFHLGEKRENGRSILQIQEGGRRERKNWGKGQRNSVGYADRTKVITMKKRKSCKIHPPGKRNAGRPQGKRK